MIAEKHKVFFSFFPFFPFVFFIFPFLLFPFRLSALRRAFYGWWHGSSSSRLPP